MALLSQVSRRLRCNSNDRGGMRSCRSRLNLAKTPFTNQLLQVGCQSRLNVIIRPEQAFNSTAPADLVEACRWNQPGSADSGLLKVPADRFSMSS